VERLEFQRILGMGKTKLPRAAAKRAAAKKAVAKKAAGKKARGPA
jgi:hypothetical protein